MSSDIEKPQDSEGYNRLLFQQSHRAMVVFDPEARCFINSNQAAARIFGYSSARPSPMPKTSRCRCRPGKIPEGKPRKLQPLNVALSADNDDENGHHCVHNPPS